MKPTTPELLTLLSSRQFFAADMWTITPVNGGVLRFTAGDIDISANGLTYSAGGQTGPYWDRTDNKAKCHWGVGTSVDTLVVDVLPGSSTIFGAPFLQAVREGFFDGAEIMLERAFMPQYGNTNYGLVRFFVGRCGSVVSGRSVTTFSINSHLELLNLQFPRNVAQVTCMNTLGDAQCQVVLSSFETTGTISGLPTPDENSFSATLGGTFAAGTFDLGTIKFTSGVLSGLSFTVKVCQIIGTTANIELVGFSPSPPGAGDAFTLFYGCNKSYTDSNGCPKFTNTPRFRGFPFVPQPTVAV